MIGTSTQAWFACLRFGAAGAALALGVGGCSSLNEHTVASAFVTPGKYEFYSCDDIQNQIRSRRTRQAELEGLMAKASEGPGGAFVSAIAYRSDYVRNQGELDVLTKAADQKQCVTKSPWSSERAVF